MQSFDYYYDDTTEYMKAVELTGRSDEASSVMFFDIETTGLSASRSALYLIGCMFLNGDRVVLRQFFSDGYEDEAKLLTCFSELLREHRILIHFNGNTFDIPYLKSKYIQNTLPDPFEDVLSVDIFALLRSLKKKLRLSSMTQKSLEEYVGLKREDMYDGGELIGIYKQYLRLNLMESTGSFGNLSSTAFPNASYQNRQWLGEGQAAEGKSGELLRLLLLHNHDDMEGMLSVIRLLSVRRFFDGEFDVLSAKQDGDVLLVTVKVQDEIVVHALRGAGMNCSSSDGEELSFSIPIYEKELKVFYKNYRDYVYLPHEDAVILKVMAGAVPQGHKEPAKPQTCYTHCRGSFVRVDVKAADTKGPLIKEDYKDSVVYIPVKGISDTLLAAAVLFTLE